MNLLLNTYRPQEKWSEAQSLLMEKITLGPRQAASDNHFYQVCQLALLSS